MELLRNIFVAPFAWKTVSSAVLVVDAGNRTALVERTQENHVTGQRRAFREEIAI